MFIFVSEVAFAFLIAIIIIFVLPLAFSTKALTVFAQIDKKIVHWQSLSWPVPRPNTFLHNANTGNQLYLYLYLYLNSYLYLYLYLYLYNNILHNANRQEINCGHRCQLQPLQSRNVGFPYIVKSLEPGDDQQR